VTTNLSSVHCTNDSRHRNDRITARLNMLSLEFTLLLKNIRQKASTETH